ncbi:MAG: NAD(P)-dependent oxidoreductase [Asgard group archaeon]|nr:NAD(P)-dependent oxidoreductase [Asgard group archaeon]
MQVLVTGASGFLGYHLVNELIINDYKVSILVRQTSNISNLKKIPGLKIVTGDLTNLESLQKGFKRQNIIFHNGSAFNEWGPYRYFYQNNVLGTKNVLEAAKSNDITRIIYTSTADIYKYQNKESYDEDSETNARGNYQKSKLKAEALLNDYSENFNFEITKIRPPGILGPRNQYMTARVKNGLKAKKVPLIGSGDQKQSYADARDVAKAIRLIAENDKTIGEIYNITSFNASVKEFWSSAAEAINKDITFVNYPYRLTYFFGWLSEIIGKITFRKSVPRATRYRINYFGKDYLIDDTKIRSELKYKPQYTLNESMNDMLNFNK